MSSDGNVSQGAVDKVAVGGDSIICTTFDSHDTRNALWMTTVLVESTESSAIWSYVFGRRYETRCTKNVAQQIRKREFMRL